MGFALSQYDVATCVTTSRYTFDGRQRIMVRRIDIGVAHVLARLRSLAECCARATHSTIVAAEREG